METIYDAIVTSKGQITIPKNIREIIKAKKGSVIQFVVGKNEKITLKPKRTFESYYGELNGMWGEDPAEEIARWRSRGSNDSARH